MKKILAVILGASLFIGILTGCSASNRVKNPVKAFPVVIEGVTIEKAPATVASLSPDISDMLLNLGYQKKLVAVSSDYEQADDAKLPAIGTGLEPDLAAIAKAKPDIVFTSVAMTSLQLKKLNDVGIQVVTFGAVTSLDKLYASIELVCKSMEGSIDGAETAKKACDSIKNGLAEIKEKIPAEKRLSYLYAISSDLKIVTPDTLQASLLAVVADNIIQEATGFVVSDEILSAAKPDVILYSAPLKAENIKASKMLGEMDAAKNDKMYEIDENRITLHGTGIVESAREIAAILYSDIDFSKAAESEQASDSASK